MKKHIKFSRIIVFLLLSILAATTLLPILYMIMATFLSKDEYMLNMFALPKALNFQNYKVVLEAFNFIRMTFNSLFVSVITVATSLLVTSLAAYSINKLSWKGKKPVMGLITVGMFMPGQVLIIPVYQILIGLNLVNSSFGLIIFYVATSIPFTTMMMIANIKGIPNQILESATIDGAGSFKIYLNVILPLLKPTLVTAAIINFISYWNELLYAMIILQDERIRTITVSIVSLTNKFGSNMPLLYAGLLLSAIPVIILYLIAQKQIIKGVSSGSLK